MADSCPTLAQPQLEAFDRERWTRTAILQPAIVLIDADQQLGTLLVRNLSPEHRRSTRLLGVRWTRIPLGWRLFLLRLATHLYAARLPAEWLYNEVQLREDAGVWRAVIMPAGPILPQPSSSPYPTRMLTHVEYQRLWRAPRREYHAAAVTLFAAELPQWRGKPLIRPA